MANIAKIELGDTTYDIKDESARSDIDAITDRDTNNNIYVKTSQLEVEGTSVLNGAVTSGSTITSGNGSNEGIAFKIKSNTIDRDADTISTTLWGPRLQYVDKDDELVGYVQAYQRSNGNTGMRMLVWNEKTDGINTWNGLSIEVDKEGAASYSMSNPTAFRTAINAVGASDQAAQDATIMTLNNTTQQWGIEANVISTTNNAYKNHRTGLVIANTNAFLYDFSGDPENDGAGKGTVWSAYTTLNKPTPTAIGAQPEGNYATYDDGTDAKFAATSGSNATGAWYWTVANTNNTTYKTKRLGAWFEDTTLRMYNSTDGATIWTAYTTKNKPTYSDVGAAAASHTHNYLPLSGGTLTGALYITDKSIYIKDNDFNRDGDNPSSKLWSNSLMFRDTDDETLGYIQAYQTTAGATGLRIYTVAEENSNTTHTNYIDLDVDKNGNKTYTIAAPATFRNAISAAAASHTHPASDITGTLGVAHGGTGVSTLGAGLVYHSASGTGALTTATAADIVSALGTTSVNRATSDSSGNNIANTYAKKADVAKQHTYINVLDYGAKGNGTTDDTQAFKDAFAAATAGDHIVIPLGGGEKYKITSYIPLNANFVTVRGEGGSNLSWQNHGIKFEPSGDTSVCFRVYGSGCVFENLVISTDNSTHAGMGIGIYSRRESDPDTDLEVINCKFTSLKHGIYHWNRGCLVRNSTFSICDHAISISADSNITTTNLQRALRIENNRFHVCAIGVWIAAEAYPYFMVINDNYLDLPATSYTEGNCLLYANCNFNGLTINGNTVADPITHAIYINGTVLKFNMSGNNIYGYNKNSTYTIRIINLDGFCISSNTISGALNSPMYVNSLRAGTITGNYILGRVETTAYGLIYISDEIYRVTISGNMFLLWNISGGYAVRYNNANAVNYFVMQGNVCEGGMFQNVKGSTLNHTSIQAAL